MGLIGAVELLADRPRNGRSIRAAGGGNWRAALQELGLINRAMADAVPCPPPVITEAEANDMFDMMEAAIDRTEAWVEKEGLRVT